MDHQVTSDALQLENCPEITSFDDRLRRESVQRQQQQKKFKANITIYVDPSSGDNRNMGSEMEPVQTIQAALKLYRSMKKTKSDSGVIYLKAGQYYLNETIRLFSQDSNLVIVGDERDKVLVSGGKKYNFAWSEYKTVMSVVGDGSSVIGDIDKAGESNSAVKYYGLMKSSEACKSACRSESECKAYTWHDDTRGDFAHMCYLRFDYLWHTLTQSGCTSGMKVTIYEADLSDQNPIPFSSLFINGRRAVRARYPNGNPETTGLHTDPTGYTRAVIWLPPIKKPPAKEIHIASPERSRSYFPDFEIGIGGPVDNFNPPESYWGLATPSGGGAKTYTIPTGLQYYQREDFNNRTWSNPKTGVVHAFHCGYWGGWQFAIEDRNMANETITFSRGGFQEARGCDHGSEYYIDNIKEELDSPGEWFYDKEEMKLYFAPNGSSPSSGVGSALTKLLSIEGSMDDPVYNITITGMTLAHSELTFLEDYAVPSGGDWAIHKEGTVFAEGIDGLTIKNCLFDSPGGNGLFLSNYVRGAVIDGNEFKFCGESGVVLMGSADLMDGTNGNQPRGTKITGNYIHEFGIFGKQTAAFCQALSAQTNFSYNIFFNGPRAGVNVNDGFGGGNFFSRNLGFNLVRETGDHGVFNTWDRQPYLTTVRDINGTVPSLTPALSNLTMNFVICNYHCTWPLDHDDGSCYYFDTFNFLTYGGYKNFLGHSKTVQNNVYVYPDASRYSNDDYDDALKVRNVFYKPFCANSDGSGTGKNPSGWDEVWTNNTCLIGNPDVYEFGSCNPVQSLKGIVPFTAFNRFYAPNETIYIQCGSERYTLKEYQMLGYDLGSQVYDSVDTQTLTKMGHSVLNF